MDTRFYVYIHRDKSGAIFYVGKGTGNRAWSKDRDDIWKRYVAERSDGVYTVEIYRDNLSEEAALNIEWRLISEFGSQLTNWINPGRAINADASHEYWRLRKESQRLTAEAKAIAKSDVTKAIELCTEALGLVHKYRLINNETGLLTELMVKSQHGDAHVIYRLVQCLKLAKRFDEISATIADYLERYPDDATHSQVLAALKVARSISTRSTAVRAT